MAQARAKREVLGSRDKAQPLEVWDPTRQIRPRLRGDAEGAGATVLMPSSLLLIPRLAMQGPAAPEARPLLPCRRACRAARARPQRQPAGTAGARDDPALERIQRVFITGWAHSAGPEETGMRPRLPFRQPALPEPKRPPLAGRGEQRIKLEEAVAGPVAPQLPPHSQVERPAQAHPLPCMGVTAATVKRVPTAARVKRSASTMPP